MHTQFYAIALLGLHTLPLITAYKELELELGSQVPLGNGAQLGGNSTCHSACTTLSTLLPSKVHYQTLPPEFFTDYYSSQQQETRPLCLVLPTTAEDVSDAIKVIGEHECVFSVKSGGHAMFVGASNAKDGITLDLRYLNGLSLSEERETVFVGTGNRWGMVYEYLDPLNLTVVGGRDMTVGVGGFLLGGGISFISRRYGFGADNVRNFQVVLANGSIADVNLATHPDLYWALRGGGSQFGIVTRFDLETHPMEPMWGGFSASLISDVEPRLNREFSWTPIYFIERGTNMLIQGLCFLGYCTSLSDFAKSMEQLTIDYATDTYAQAYGCLVFHPKSHNYIYSTQLTHGKGLEDSKAFGKLQSSKKVFSLNRLAKNSDFARDITEWRMEGTRIIYETATLKPDAGLIADIMDIYISEADAIRHLNGFGGTYVFQIITKDEISHSSKHGGNCLGLKEEDGPLLLVSTALAWKDANDDKAVHEMSHRVIDRSVSLAKERGLWHPFIYQNYASKNQDVFGGFPPENRLRLKEIQKKYDPEQLFTRLKNGYFQP